MGAILDARALREAMAGYLEALRAHREELDSLNVFPVPDGDTGTNLVLTQEAVAAALEAVPRDDLPALAEAVSRAALMGARGNSGVILSQVLRGLCDGLVRSTDLAPALEEASRQAHLAVAQPAEGTMLSVLRDAAEAAGRASGNGAGPERVAEASLREGLAALERTRDQLPALRDAGVVDAGGRGVVLLLDAVVAVLRNASRTVAVGPGGPVGRPRQGTSEASSRYGFEVMYLLECQDLALPALRERLGAIGDSLAVVGAAGLYNVHVHTDDPGPAVEHGVEAGRPRGIRISSLDEQVAAHCVAREARAVRVPAVGGEASAIGDVGVVAVARGAGLARLFRSLGAIVTSDESLDGLVRAAEEAPVRSVLLLPNHPEAVAAAERAAGLASKAVRVIPTRSPGAGIAAAAAFTPEASLEENTRAAAEAAGAVSAGEVRRAVRDGSTEAGGRSAGDVVGVVDEEVRVIGTDPVDVLGRVAMSMARDGHEVLTLLVGRDVSDGDLRRAGDALARKLPAMEIEVHRGDQPGSIFQIGIE